MRSALVGLFAIFVIARASLFLGYAWLRWDDPLDVFALEAKMVHHAWRFQHGLDLYPSWEQSPYIPNFFAPLYFVIVGAIGGETNASIDGLFLIGRVVTLLAVASTAVGTAWTARRLFGLGWQGGVLVAAVTLGGLPLLGFGLMVRPDALAESIGLCGAALVVLRGLGWRTCGIVLLALGVLTKQTAGVYILAAAAALLVSPDRRGWGLLTLILPLVLAGAVVVLGTLAWNPRFLPSLLAESASPFQLEHWWATTLRMLKYGPDQLLIPGLGVLSWSWWSTPRRPALAAFSAVVLGVNLLASGKMGSDQNYFLSFRVIEALAVGSLLIATFAPSSSPTSTRSTAIGRGLAWLAATIVIVPSMLILLAQVTYSYSYRSFQSTPQGRSNLGVYREFYRMARDPSRMLLTENGLIALRQGERAPFVDPWLFRMLAVQGRIEPDDLQERIERQEYEYLILTSELFSKVYETYEFGLPPKLLEAARRNYRLTHVQAGLFIYAPNRARLDSGKLTP